MYDWTAEEFCSDDRQVVDEKDKLVDKLLFNCGLSLTNDQDRINQVDR